MATKSPLYIDPKSLAGFNKALKKVSVDVRRKGAVAAIRRGGRVIVTKAKNSGIPKQTGALKKSLTVKVRNARSKYKDAYAVYGPAGRYLITAQRPGYRKPMRIRPGFYGHLVERGRKSKRISNGFLSQAANASRGRLVPEMAKVLERSQAQAALRYKSKYQRARN